MRPSYLFLLILTLSCSDGLLPVGPRGVFSFGGIRATRAEPDSVRLDWDRVAGAAGYTTYRVKDGIASEIESVAGSVSGYTVTGLTKNTTYTFRARAKDANGKYDENINDVTVTTPATINTEGLPLSATGNILAHWRSSSGITMDGEGQVTRWADQSGNGYDLAWPGSGTEPLWEDGALNGLPAIHFRGGRLVNDELIFSAPDQSSTLLALFAPRYFELGGPSVIHELISSVGSSQLAFGIIDGNADLILGGIGEGSGHGANLPLNENTYYVATYTAANSVGRVTLNFWLDGVQGTPLEYDTSNSFDSGATVGYQSRDFVVELLLYDRVLTAEERKEAEGYFAERGGLNIEN